MNDKVLPNDYLDYEHRRYGMDHDRYDWSMLAKRTPVSWPEDNNLALWVNVPLQYYPLNQSGTPFKVPGGMTMPYPDLRHYSLREYGNRVGLFRVLSALDKRHVKPTFAVNTRLLERTPYLTKLLQSRSDEVICHGYHMDALHYAGQDPTAESQLIARALDSLRKLTGQPVTGWLSPARNESGNTPDLLARNGIDYFCDWVNDDMPYPFKTDTGALIAMPLSNELEDRFVIQNNLHSEASWCQQVCDACDFLLDEAQQQGGRILALNVHPWLLGQPHRIGHLEAALDYITRRPGVWSASAGDIMRHWKQQQT